MAGDEGPLPVVRPVEVVVLDLQKLRKAVGGALGLAHKDVGDGCALDGAGA